MSITGEGVIDGAHIQDKKGEEGMRGPHILFLSRSKGIKISGVKLRRASNYAFMSYDIERASFDNLLVEEGWGWDSYSWRKRYPYPKLPFLYG